MQENLDWEQHKFSEQMKSKEQLEKERLEQEAEIQSLQKYVAAEKEMLQKEQEAADQRLAMQMTRTEARQEQCMAAVRAAGEALKLLQSEQTVPGTSAALIVTQGVGLGTEVMPGDVTIRGGPNLPVQSSVQCITR